jgi:predicted ATP-binding protein involved in virulence
MNKIFRIEYLKLNNHPQLGDIELFLSDNGEIANVKKPYISVIIGPNGTGKSLILRTISDILTQLNIFQTSGIRNLNLPFHFHLRFQNNKDNFEILNYKDIFNERTTTKIYEFYRNRPFIDFNEDNSQINKKCRIDFSEIVFPNKLIVSSILQTDRFIFKNNNPNDFYQYLGSRSTSSTSSTKSSSRKTIKFIFNSTTNNIQFKNNLKDLLSFLDFEESLKINYSTKINKLFFSGELTEKNFKRYYEQWWHDDFEFSNRKKENPLWSVPYYNNNYKENKKLLIETITLLNDIAKNRLTHKPYSRSKVLSIDLFDENLIERELEIIKHLEQLDIISLDGIKINKNNSTLSLSDVSSGEFHLIISMIGIFSKIEDNSLILIDEPEISLHPNWQMQYVTFLKKVFSKNSSCQFIITTHSHFLVSDLEGESSSVTALNRDTENKLISNLIKADTFGWSAEDILYNVFNVRSVRNYFIQADLTDLLGLISENSKNKEKIISLVNKLSELQTSENDPLRAVLIEANSYLDKL